MRSRPDRPGRRAQICIQQIEPGHRIAGNVRKEFARILKDGFPKDQRDKVSILMASIRSGQRQCFMARAGNTIIGLAVLQNLGDLDIVRLDRIGEQTGEIRRNNEGGLEGWNQLSAAGASAAFSFFGRSKRCLSSTLSCFFCSRT